MKKNKILLFGLLLGFQACIEPEAECKEVQIQKVQIGFYRSLDSLYYLPIDTLFNSVYVPGKDAEMRGRRIGNFYYLPFPATGGEVQYVFEQGSNRDTLAIRGDIEAAIEDSFCPAKVRVTNIRVLSDQTTYPIDSVVVNPYYYGYEAKISIVVP